MNLDIIHKLNQLNEMDKDACWYIVRQELSFWKMCYAVAILEEFKENNRGLNLEKFFENRAQEISAEKGFDKFISTHRMLYNAYYYGILRKVSREYAEASPTEVYYEIIDRCQGNFENTDLYIDIIIRQIEKIYIASKLDEKYDGLRSKYKLYPIFLLLKVIVELGQVTGEYKISIDEFYSFVGTTTEYKDYLLTVFYILESRKRNENGDELFLKLYNKVKNKFNGNRFNQVLKNLPYFKVEPNYISLNEDYLEEIKLKLFQFEMQPVDVNYDYLNFLYSKESLLPNQRRNFIINFENENKNKDITANKYILKSFKYNRLLYGAPGTGKSYLLEQDARKYFNYKNVKRITFHPNMSYGQFVGTYKPRPKRNNSDLITYKFVPGIFLIQLTNALLNQSEDYLIIIEELNRANVQAVFGDIFQLLDRDVNGKSKYGIAVPEEMKEYFETVGLDITELFLPSNFYIWATMNTADQGVQPIDTAFTRRFEDYEYIDINNNEEIIEKYPVYINGIGNVNWNKFRKKLNRVLLDLNVKEDKLIGPFFINENVLGNNEEFQRAFKNKLLFYLAENVFKHNKSKLFKEKTFYDIIKQYEKDDENIFLFEFEM